MPPHLSITVALMEAGAQAIHLSVRFLYIYLTLSLSLTLSHPPSLTPSTPSLSLSHSSIQVPVVFDSTYLIVLRYLAGRSWSVLQVIVGY